MMYGGGNDLITLDDQTTKRILDPPDVREAVVKPPTHTPPGRGVGAWTRATPRGYFTLYFTTETSCGMIVYRGTEQPCRASKSEPPRECSRHASGRAAPARGSAD